MYLLLSDVILNSFILVLNYVPLLKLCVIIESLVGIVFTDSKSPISFTSIERENIITVFYFWFGQPYHLKEYVNYLCMKKLVFLHYF